MFRPAPRALVAAETVAADGATQEIAASASGALRPPRPQRIVTADWWAAADTKLPGLETAPLITQMLENRIIETPSVGGARPPWALGESMSLYEDMGVRDPAKTYMIYWLNIGDVSILSVAEVLDRRRFELAFSGDALSARLKFVLQPCGLKLPVPVKTPRDADTIGVFFGKHTSCTRSRTNSGVDYVCLRVDLYSKWLLKKAMQTVGFRKGSVFDIVLIDWPGRTVIMGCRLTITDTFLKLMGNADGASGNFGFAGLPSLW